MIIIIAKLTVKPGQKSELIKICQPLIESSKREKGNISYELFQNQKSENVLAFIEEWKDQDAIDFHNKTDEFKKIASILDQYVESPLEVDFYTKL